MMAGTLCTLRTKVVSRIGLSIKKLGLFAMLISIARLFPLLVDNKHKSSSRNTVRFTSPSCYPFVRSFGASQHKNHPPLVENRVLTFARERRATHIFREGWRENDLRDRWLDRVKGIGSHDDERSAGGRTRCLSQIA